MESNQVIVDELGENRSELKRTMGFFTALSTVMGTVIGAGVFFKAASVAEVTGSVSLHMFSWFLGGVISVCAGLTGAELAAAIPETGGMVKYIERTYGKTAAFLLGWAQVVIYFPANVAALSIIFGTQFVNLFDLSQSMIVPVAILAAVTILLINLLGSKIGGAFQSITLVCKLIPLFVIVLFGLFRSGGVDFQLFPIVAGKDLSFFSALGAGLLATMFAYDGWIHVGNIAGELKKTAKDLPKAISMGIIGIMIVYLLVNAVFLKTASIEGISGNSNAASEVATMIFGGFGGKLVTIGILISVYGTINGYTLTGMRLPYVMAQENRLPFSKHLGKLTERTNVPLSAGILELVVAILMMMVGGLDMLTDMLVFVIWIFYTMVFIGVIILRKTEPSLKRPYKVPLYPIIPLIAIIGGGFIVVSTLLTQTFLALSGIAMTLAGIPVYLYLKNKYS
ncbi:APC family permease [Enterococcus villorum]|uniref:Amino acid permease n=2 Tax=Enterococcus villorum TaxID=112904 RepID=A0A511IYE9_9ENTE|nr:amino acid permease [Enterococcus villorum]EOH89855.1 amino acid permease [Enterococcus villorum ATCC 700913]EOW78087.1 amino acid permease [Enterococcus villorum ATCC 700913]GEL90802.1 amino acid permease [Enterococcus villorum]